MARGRGEMSRYMMSHLTSATGHMVSAAGQCFKVQCGDTQGITYSVWIVLIWILFSINLTIFFSQIRANVVCKNVKYY